MKGTGAFF